MTNDEIYVMKLKLQAYNANVRRFEQEKQKYEEILYNMQGVHAVSWGKVGRRESLSDFSRIIAMLPKKDRQAEKLRDIYRDIQVVDELLARMDAEERKLVIEYYIDNARQKELAAKYGKTEKQIEREINRAIRKAL